MGPYNHFCQLFKIYCPKGTESVINVIVQYTFLCLPVNWEKICVNIRFHWFNRYRKWIFHLSNIYLSCVPYVASFSGVSFLLPLRYSLKCISSVSCVPYVASFSGLSIFYCTNGILYRLFITYSSALIRLQ